MGRLIRPLASSCQCWMTWHARWCGPLKHQEILRQNAKLDYINGYKWKINTVDSAEIYLANWITCWWIPLYGQCTGNHTVCHVILSSWSTVSKPPEDMSTRAAKRHSLAYCCPDISRYLWRESGRCLWRLGQPAAGLDVPGQWPSKPHHVIGATNRGMPNFLPLSFQKAWEKGASLMGNFIGTSIVPIFGRPPKKTKNQKNDQRTSNDLQQHNAVVHCLGVHHGFLSRIPSPETMIKKHHRQYRSCL